ncbi:LAME_0D05446g1_1 [Lachancea meyersii CBS 8951]|uniref:LAME_0D05446g1_1 n=1 Tax=Lachancea meyersii CBS 8951 TaxID=1266667 RepID=A0A1G4J8N1_9SACH|nr:LAME_0D05446g1_1 [Lachancea meyersii CBS 8951]
MNSTKHVSRSELYDDNLSSPSSSTEWNEAIIPEFEYVSVVKTGEDDQKESTENAQANEEFDFPLFSFGTTMENVDRDSSLENPDDDEGRGRTSTRLIKVSLREPSPEFFNNERHRSFYFADYTEEDLEKFKNSAIDYELATKEHKFLGKYSIPGRKSRVLCLEEHNEKIETERLKELKRRNRRSGKKQREARKLGLERVKQRLEDAKAVRKLMKKKFHKRGGKKNKKRQIYLLNHNRDCAQNESVN